MFTFVCDSGAIGSSSLPWPSRLTFISPIVIQRRQTAEMFAQAATEFAQAADKAIAQYGLRY